MQRSCPKEVIPQTRIQFEITISFSPDADAEDELIMDKSITNFEYLCQFDNCNNELTYDKIEEAIDDHIDFSSMHQVFSTNFQEKRTTKFNTESTSFSTSSSSLTSSTTQNPSSSTSEQKTTQRTNNSILHFISMNILILHILFLTFF